MLERIEIGYGNVGVNRWDAVASSDKGWSLGFFGFTQSSQRGKDRKDRKEDIGPDQMVRLGYFTSTVTGWPNGVSAPLASLSSVTW